MSRTEGCALALIMIFAAVGAIYSGARMHYWMQRRPPKGQAFGDETNEKNR
jgi:hypothetical protein